MKIAIIETISSSNKEIIKGLDAASLSQMFKDKGLDKELGCEFACYSLPVCDDDIFSVVSSLRKIEEMDFIGIDAAICIGRYAFAVDINRAVLIGQNEQISINTEENRANLIDDINVRTGDPCIDAVLEHMALVPMPYNLLNICNAIDKLRDKEVHMSYFDAEGDLCGKVVQYITTYSVNKHRCDSFIELSETFDAGELFEKIKEKLEKRFSRKKVLMITSQMIIPSSSNEQNEVRTLARALSINCDVTIINGHAIKDRRISSDNSITEISYREQGAFKSKRTEMRNVLGVISNDVTDLVACSDNRLFFEKLKKNIEQSDIVVLSHSFLYSGLKAFLHGKTLIYQVHNNGDYNAKKAIYPSSVIRINEILLNLKDNERDLINKADIVVTGNEFIKENAEDYLKDATDKTIFLPNDVDDLLVCDMPTKEEKKLLQDKYGCGGRRIAVFYGEYNRCDTEAVDYICEISEYLKDYVFFVIGGVCKHFAHKKLPNSVGLIPHAYVSELVKYIKVADVCIVPAFARRQIAINDIRFMVNGIPTITTDKFYAADLQHEVIVCKASELTSVLKERKYPDAKVRQDIFDRIDVYHDRYSRALAKINETIGY